MGDAKTSAGQASSYRMELAQKDQAQRDMREKIQQLEDEIEQVKEQVIVIKELFLE